MAKNVRMKDIAERLGISVVAVSKAFSGKSGVSEELREEIIRTGEEMGYHYNSVKLIARDPSHRTDNICVLTSEKFVDEDAFYLKYYKHISSAVQDRGYYAFFHTLSPSDEENLVFPSVLSSDRTDGIIILGKLSREYTAEIIRSRIPAVFLDYYDDRAEIDSVICDSFYASYDMTNYLIGNGHRKIAFVGTVTATGSIEDRCLGYVKSLIEHNIHVSRNYILDDRTEDGTLIDVALPVDMPTAFVCNCDQTAARLISQLKNEGYRIPDDISVTGFDNSVYSSVSEPKITTAEVDTLSMAEKSVEILLRKISNPRYTTGRSSVGANMIYRNSVRSINKKG